MVNLTMDVGSASHLERLPVELLHRVVRHLSTRELGDVRLTCRKIERSLFHNFTHEFFRRKQFMFSDFSLQTLVDIAKHPAFSQTLQHVSFGLDKFSATPDCYFETPEKAVHYHNAAAAQLTLLSSGRGLDMLVEAFARLPNLTTVDIRDFNSPTRSRDISDTGNRAVWSSYGAPTILRSTGVRIGVSNVQKSENAGAMFALVVAALAKAEARPQSLQVLLRNQRVGTIGDRETGLPDYCFDLTTHDPVRLQRLLSGIRTLHVDVALHCRVNNYNTTTINRINNLHNPRREFQPVVLASPLFNAFVAQLESLEWLRINFQHAGLTAGDIFLENFANPESPLASSPLFSRPWPSLPPLSRNPLTSLQRLDLGHTHVSPPVLLATIKRIPTLKALSLQGIALLDFAHTDQNTPIWAVFLRQLPSVADLNDISLAFVTESRRSASNPYPVIFGRAQHARYQGRHLNDFLTELADKAQSLEDKEEPSHDSETDEEEDD